MLNLKVQLSQTLEKMNQVLFTEKLGISQVTDLTKQNSEDGLTHSAGPMMVMVMIEFLETPSKNTNDESQNIYCLFI